MSDKRTEVRNSFSAIAGRYDLMNSLCSFGVERRWRRIAVETLRLKKEMRVLDLCAGTMTVSVDVAHAAGGVRVTALDFCPEMLQAGRNRLKPHDLEWIDPVCAEGEKIPIADGTFDGAIVTYGVRNLHDTKAGVNEVFRVLKPGGRFVILEFTRPTLPIFRTLYHLYVARIMPALGALVTRSPEAYHYLSRSIGEFMDPGELIALLEGAGFEEAGIKRLTFGIVGLYTAVKPES
jgi:demethylmenaquinone methyltransferase / 2-methoxy-6-polyprenyl-1,4-benzoquinol methylase